MGRTTELRREVKRRFHPLARQHGFSIDKANSPFGVDFRRITPEFVDVFDIQWDKYGLPRFVINFSKCPGSGVILHGELIPPAKVLANMGPKFGRLQPASGADTRSWFRQDRYWFQRVFLRRSDRPAAEVVEELIALFPELEEWFRYGKLGPHLRMISYSPLRDKTENQGEHVS